MPIEESLLEKKVFDIVAEILEVNADALTTESAMGSIPRWDSLSNLKIIFELEARFDVVFDLDDLIEVRSIADCIGLVKKVAK